MGTEIACARIRQIWPMRELCPLYDILQNSEADGESNKPKRELRILNWENYFIQDVLKHIHRRKTI